MGQINVTPEILAKLKEFAKDEQISPDEMKALEKAGASEELMEAIQTKDLHVDGDTVTFTSKKKEHAAGEKPKKSKSFGESLGVAGMFTAATTAIGGLVGGVLGGIFGVGAGAVPGAIAGAKLGAIAGALISGASMLTSCNDVDLQENGQTGPNVNIKVDSTVNLNLNVSVDKSDSDNVTAILAFLQEYGSKVTNAMEEILKKLVSLNMGHDQIMKILKSLVGDNEQLKELLGNILVAVRDGNSIGENNNKVLTEILTKMNLLQGSSDEVKALLNTIIAQIDINNDMTTDQSNLLKAILDAINNMNDNMATGMQAILAKLGDLSTENKALLEAILAKMGDMDKANQDNFAAILNAIAQGNKINAEGVKVLTAILNKLNKMDASTQANFKAVIDMLVKGNNIDAEILNKLNQVLAKLDKIDAHQANFFAQVLAKFDKLNAGQQANLDKILDAINANTTVAKGTYELVAKLLDKVDKLGGKADEIIEVIANLSVGGNVDLSKIESMLEAILAQNKANGDTLLDIDSKIGVLALTVQGWMNQISDDNDEIKKLLKQILDKIPEGCHCEPADLTVIIKILEEIRDKDGNKHEGILDDLDELFK